MEKINLCMPVGKWLSMHIRKGAMGWTEFKVAVFGGFDDFSMSLLCKSTESEMLQISDLDENVLAAYSDALEEAGLRFGMTDWELDAYRREYEAERGTKLAPKADNIDWEQRRWEFAKYLYELDYDTSTPGLCIKKADKFIEVYKRTLNAED